VFKNRELKILWLVLLTMTLEILVFALLKSKVFLALLPIYIFLLGYTLYKTKGKASWQTLIESKPASRRILWRQTLNRLPIGIAIMDQEERIVWGNKAYSAILKEFGKTASLKDIISPEDFKSLREGDKVERFIINERIFSIRPYALGPKNEKEGRCTKVLCFYDDTEFYNLKKQLDEKDAVIGYIHVDSFDELIAYSEENRPELLAKIDKLLTQWVHSYNGLIKKYDNDKYLVILSFSEFERAKEDKFSVLDAVKEIKIGPAISVTLSIGAAYGRDNLAQTTKTAQKALELCLGRGGDQIVVKTEDKTYFYGGKTKEVERYSRVRARVISQALKDLMEESDTVLIMGHMYPDMDALGAAVGVYSAAKYLEKPAYIVMDSNQTASVESLMELLLDDADLRGAFLEESAALDKVTWRTLLVVVDTHRPSFCLSQKVLEKTEKVVIIDHHRRVEEFIEKALLVYLEPYASSTSEMVSEILQYMGDDLHISPVSATALLSGIAVDTQNFAFKTGVRTFEAASFLRRLGADPMLVYKLFQEDIEIVSARNQVVARAEEVFRHIVISFYDEKPKNPSLSAALAANSLLELKGVLSSFVLVPTDEGIAISGRSLGNINVQRVLEKLGGGGHITVAGAQLPGVTVHEALDKIKQAISEYLTEGETK